MIRNFVIRNFLSVPAFSRPALSCYVPSVLVRIRLSTCVFVDKVTVLFQAPFFEVLLDCCLLDSEASIH